VKRESFKETKTGQMAREVRDVCFLKEPEQQGRSHGTMTSSQLKLPVHTWAVVARPVFACYLLDIIYSVNGLGEIDLVMPVNFIFTTVNNERILAVALFFLF
jgi:hypothetical protein